jgi:hypothetical protein
MPSEEILEDILSKFLETSTDSGGFNFNPETTGNTLPANYVSPQILVETLERECNARYKDPANGLHFVGLLLAVFVADVVSAYWERNSQIAGGNEVTDPAWMVSCLYSSDNVGLTLSPPVQVVPFV